VSPPTSRKKKRSAGKRTGSGTAKKERAARKSVGSEVLLSDEAMRYLGTRTEIKDALGRYLMQQLDCDGWRYGLRAGRRRLPLQTRTKRSFWITIADQ